MGARLDDDKGDASGSAYIFERNQGGANNWGQIKKLTAALDGAAGDQFGFSVGISGDTVVVGAFLDDDINRADSGSAYVFERDSDGIGEVKLDNWGEVKKLLAFDGASGDFFGVSVSISGDTVVVGAEFGNGNMADSGSVYVFVKPVDGWEDSTQEDAKLAAKDGAGGATGSGVQ